MSFNLSSAPFSSTSDWNQLVPTGATYTSLNWPAATGYNYAVTWSHDSPGVYVASSSDPVVTVTGSSGWGWPNTLNINIPTGVTGAVGGVNESNPDKPLLVIEPDGTVYNFWHFNRTSNTTATADAWGESNVVTGTGWGTSSQGAGIVAAGSSELGGLLVQAQTDTGTIDHALQLALNSSLLAPGYVSPAVGGDGQTGGAPVQEGDLLAIPKGAQMPSGLSTLGQEVFRALQQYGAYVTDNGTDQTAIRADANGYSASTISALQTDLNKFLPMLDKVTGGTPAGPGPSSVSSGSSSASTPSSVTAAPTVAITSGGGTVTSASQTIRGTVDAADAGSTVKVLDGSTQIGSATVGTNGAWSANVTLPNQAANVITATDTNAGGTGTSGAVTYDYEPPAPSAPATTPTAPTLKVANQSLYVSPGGSIALGVSVPNAGDNVSVTISGLPKYETITDNLDSKIFSGSSVTLTAAEVNSGLSLNSSYRGHGHPTATLTVTATDNTGTPISSPAQSITVVDPPATTTSSGTGTTGMNSGTSTTTLVTSSGTSTTTSGSGTSSGHHWHHHWAGQHHNAVAASNSGTSTTRSSTSSGQSQTSQTSHTNVAQWFNDHPDFARAATTLSEAGASRSGVVSAPSTTTTTDPAASAGTRAYALLNQMMAGDFGRDSHFAQAATALSALSQQQANLLTRPLH